MIFLNDTKLRNNLFPITLTRHTALIRIGILTIKQKWEYLLKQEVFLSAAEGRVEVPANVIPTKENYKEILHLAELNNEIVQTDKIKIIIFPWHIFQLNDYALNEDYKILTSKLSSQKIEETNKVISKEKIFIGKNVHMEHCILNASTGPIFIDDNAIVQEGTLIRGPFYLGKNSVVKMGTRIFGATTIGDSCVVGGEIKNSVIFDYSNKAHDGYLGDSVLGSWCNLGDRKSVV